MPNAEYTELFRAVLVDAIRCLHTGRTDNGGVSKSKPRPRHRDRVFREALVWFYDDTDWPFSFSSICHALDLNPEATRARVLSGKAVSL